MLHLLRDVTAEDIPVTIGTEHPATGGGEASIVAAPFQAGETALGAIGVVGPAMDYISVMASVRAVARAVRAGDRARHGADPTCTPRDVGIHRDASQEDIRRAYRLAREYHPDVSRRTTPRTDSRSIAAACEILGSAEAPAVRPVRPVGRPDGLPFGDVADIFEAFFGSGFGRCTATARRSRVQRGEDVFASVSLRFEDAAFGAHRDVEIERLQTCDRCAGSARARHHADALPRLRRRGSGAGRPSSIFGTVAGAPVRGLRGDEEIRDAVRTRAGVEDGSATHTVPVDIPAVSQTG